MKNLSFLFGVLTVMIVSGAASALDNDVVDSDTEQTTTEAVGGDVLAQSGEASESSSSSGLADYVESQLSEPEQSFPYIENHGYFRFRADNFWNLDLNTQGTSPVLPPLEATPRVEESIPADRGDFYDPEAELLSSANIRFRYHPIVHITDTMRINAEIDLLDNLVLGSTPDGFTAFGASPDNRFDVPLVAFTPGQQVPNEDLTLGDSIRVRQAYAEMNFLGLIRVGRMASNWGLGILANSGGAYNASPLAPRTSHRGVALQGFNCMDCDYGDLVDRFMFITRPLSTVYVGFVYDWASSGTVSYLEDQPQGQARDLSQIDDVSQFGFIAVRSHNSDAERRERDRRLKELRLPVIEGGVYLVHREQQADQGQTGFFPNDTETAFAPRLATAWIPDLWVRLLWEPAFKRRIRLELEAVMIVGDIENVEPGLPDDDGGSARELNQLGIAFESDFRFNNLTTGLNAGYASGRSTEGENARLAPGWGVQDFNPVTGGSQSDRDVTNFKFDRDYFVDSIMFREVIGTITNAVYFNPYVQYDFFTAQTSAMGARLDGIYAMAPQPEVTPGGESGIGLEVDATVYYKSDNYQADVSGGAFFPFGAFNGVTDRARIPSIANFYELNNSYEAAVDAEEAFTLQFRLMWAF